MSIIDLKCQDSINSSTCFCIVAKPSEFLILGHNYQIYLFFELPAFIYPCNLLHVRLVLFKLPQFDMMAENSSYADNRYKLYPLLDFFSAYSPLFSPPEVDSNRKVIFFNDCHKGWTEIDITGIVSDWKNNQLENKGLLLTGYENSQFISFASSRHRLIGMRPMLRLTFEEPKIFHPLKGIPCEINTT